MDKLSLAELSRIGAQIDYNIFAKFIILMELYSIRAISYTA